VLEAEDGQKALDSVAADRPDIILMDLSIPNVDGWECTRRLKANDATRAIPIIALTAHAMRGDEERARAAGCDHYLSKPISPKKVVEEVKRMLKLT
jgi:CheY-like chemotaxis protein